MDITIKIERKVNVDGIGTIHLTQIGETFELSNTAILGVRSLEGRRQPLSERYYIKSGQKVPQALRKAILKEQGKPEWQRPQPPEISQLRSCLGHGAGHENLDLVVARPDPDRGIALEVLGEVVSITRFGRPLSDDPRASDRRFFTAVSALSGPDLTLEKIQPAVIRLLQVAEKEDLETLDNLILKVGADSELWTSVCRDKSVHSVLESAVAAALHTPNCDTAAMEIAMKRFEINYAQAFPDACKDGLRHQLSQFEIQIESELLCFCRRVKQYCPDIITAPEVKGALTTFATATSQISGGRARAEDVWSALGLESSELDLIAAEAFKELKPPGVLDQAAILLGNVRNKELFIQDPEVEDKAIELILELCMQPHKRVKPEDLLRDSGLAPAALAVKLPLLLRLPEGEARRADFFAFFASRISRILEQSAEKPPWNMRNADGLLRLFEAHLKGGLLATQVRTWASQLGIEETLGDQAHDWLSGEIIFAKKSNKLSFFGQQVLKAFPNLKEDKDFRPDLIKLGEINEEA
ncbi:MAG: hypothetical protein DCC75_04535 [Proteobacteria bacterium]|nr:MAG: hypothetical protein DCC75_04535 [Pseudomonadota bacterium]